jgi:tetratricopeptide (TPR) repeat protein
MRALAAVVALVLGLMVAPAASAQTLDGPAKTQRLDELFAQLKAAKSEAEGLALEEQIVAIWLQSGDPMIDEKMEWGVLAMNTGSFDLALGYFDSIVLNKPDFAEGWNKRATLYYLMGKNQESLDDIAKTLALEPRHFGALAGKGLVMLELGQDEQALAAFKQALVVDPQLTQIQVQAFLLEDKLKRNRI